MMSMVVIVSVLAAPALVQPLATLPPVQLLFALTVCRSARVRKNVTSCPLLNHPRHLEEIRQIQSATVG